MSKHCIKKYDTSDELYLERYKQGVRFIPVDYQIQDLNPSSNHFLKNIMKLPFCIYLMNKLSEKIRLNEYSVAACGFNSAKHAIGKTVAHVLKPSSAKSIMGNDHDVINTSNMRIIEEFADHKNNQTVEALSIKLPWYNSNDEIIGVFGCSNIYGVHSIPDFLITARQLRLLNQSNEISLTNIQNIHLTKREANILKFTLRGWSSKNIGKQLYISSRTVEFHLENLKIKFNVSSKSDLIDKIMCYRLENTSVVKTDK